MSSDEMKSDTTAPAAPGDPVAGGAAPTVAGATGTSQGGPSQGGASQGTVMEGPSEADRAAVRRGLRTFGVIWLGQVISLFGSSLTGFALGVWVFQETGSVMQFGFISLFVMLPGILLSPIGGAMVDRWDRRWVLIGSDAVSALTTVVILYLVWQGNLAVWHIYLLALFGSIASAFQWPAFTATTPLLVPKEHLARASGLMQSGTALAQVLAPLVAGALLVTIGLEGVVVIDLATFVVAVGLLLVIRIPKPKRSKAGEEGKGTVWKESLYGWHYVKKRPGLFQLLLLFAAINFSFGMVQIMLTPMVLSFSTASVLGQVISVGSFGMLVGGITISVWGGPKKKVHGIFLFLALSSSVLFLGGVEPSALLIAGAAFFFLFCIPIVNGCSQAIWQRKVDPDVQGRVFAFRRMLAAAATPLAYVIGGPAADYFFEPALAADGLLADSVGRLIGTGPGRGLGLMFMILGVLMLLVLLVGWASPRLRNVEQEIPDAVDDLPLAAQENVGMGADEAIGEEPAPSGA